MKMSEFVLILAGVNLGVIINDLTMDQDLTIVLANVIAMISCLTTWKFLQRSGD